MEPWHLYTPDYPKGFQRMQDLLTAATELVTVSFVLIMAFDFVVGLKCIAQPTQLQNNIRLKAITPMAETFKQSTKLSAPWMLQVDLVSMPSLK